MQVTHSMVKFRLLCNIIKAISKTCSPQNQVKHKMSSDEFGDNSPPRKRKQEIFEKTPISVLKELCDQEGALLMFEHSPHNSNTKQFSCTAKAFNISAEGCGRSKKEAEHDSCVNLISQLQKFNQFKNQLPIVSQVRRTPHPVSDGDAISALFDICVQRKCPLPKFSEVQKCGKPHRPVFTVNCQVSSITRTGTFKTIKGAKQLAARAILQIIQTFSQNGELQQIATVEAEPPEKLFQTYREHKKAEIKPIIENIRDRHNFFLRLPKDHRDGAERILTDDCGIHGSNKDKVDLACKVLQLKYNIRDVVDRPQLKIFYLEGNHDCVIVNQEPDLYDDIIKHMKIMLNIRKMP